MVHLGEDRRSSSPSPFDSVQKIWPNLRPAHEGDTYRANELAQTIKEFLPETIQELVTPEFWQEAPSTVLHEMIGADAEDRQVVKLEFVEVKEDVEHGRTIQSAIINPAISYQVGDGGRTLSDQGVSKVKAIAVAQLLGSREMEQNEIAEWVPGVVACFVYDQIERRDRIAFAYQLQHPDAIQTLIAHVIDRYQPLTHDESLPIEADLDDEEALLESMKLGKSKQSVSEQIKEQWGEDKSQEEKSFAYLQFLIEQELKERFNQVGISFAITDSPTIISVSQPDQSLDLIEVTWEGPGENGIADLKTRKTTFDVQSENGFIKLVAIDEE